MHTFSTDGLIINYNSDGSGYAIVKGWIWNTNKRGALQIPCKGLISFVASLRRNQMIGKIEQMTDEEILKFKFT